MKIKLFGGNGTGVENAVNDFIKDVDVIDIKFSSSATSFDVMVIYNDETPAKLQK